MPALDPAFAVAIRTARRAARLSQVRLARLCSLSVRHVTEIERGGDFSVAVLVKLARHLPALRIDEIVGALIAQTPRRAHRE